VAAARIGKCVLDILVAAALGLCGGCQTVGPVTIDAGRDRYNSVIQSTAKVQKIANIIRVKYNEPMSFMDVTEVDTGTSVTGTATGTVAGIGPAKGTTSQLGTISSGVTYAENPTIRYIPLTGQGLVAQLLQPLSPDALVNLLGSDWEPNQTLELTLHYMTPDLSISPAVTNIVERLYSNGRHVTFAATKSDLTPVQQSSTAAQPQAGATGGKNSNNKTENDSITLYFHWTLLDKGTNRDALHNWIRLLFFYYDTQVNLPPKNCAPVSKNELRARDLAMNRDVPQTTLDGWERCLPHSIELRTVPAQSDKAQDKNLLSETPQLRMYSAAGILKSAVGTGQQLILFVPPDKYNTIHNHAWNARKTLSFYQLLPEDANLDLSNDSPKTRSELINVIEHGNSYDLYDPPQGTADVTDFLHVNEYFLGLRCYILIIMDDHPPKNPYVTYFYQGKWYYIAAEDTISQKNFDLISQLLTMMAVPPTTQQLTPTISVN